jgi:ribonucleoside-diphosphate reductase beta chain
MAYTTFSQNKNDQLLEPMFFGQSVNVARYDQQKYDIFRKADRKAALLLLAPGRG